MNTITSSAVTQAEQILSNKDLYFGQLRKTDLSVPDNYNESKNTGLELTKRETFGTRVTISQTAQSILALNQIQPASSNTSAEGFDDFLADMHRQLTQDGNKAEVLGELVTLRDPARSTLAMQTANYLSAELYSGDKAFQDSSTSNPFSELDRLTLSKIAFDDSGRFSSAERYVSFLEITRRDTEYQNEVFDFYSAWESQNDTKPWLSLVSLSSHAELASGMSDAERDWRNWGTEEEIRLQATKIAEKSETNIPDLPGYDYLKAGKSDLLVMNVSSNGEASWLVKTLSELSSEKMNQNLLETLVLNKKPKHQFLSQIQTSSNIK